jgi:hypothetical protein
MRKKTLAGLAAFLSFVTVFALSLADVRIPFGVSSLVAVVVFAPVLLVPLTIINKRLLAWRKARGRDIEEEEKYEDDASGIISLRPREK